MHGQREVKVIGYAVIVAALICLTGLMLSGGCSRTGGDGGGTAQQIDRAAELNRQAGAEVKAAAGAVGRAEQHAEQAAELNQSAQAGVSDCKKLVEQIRADNRRAKRILDELIREAESGCAQGEKN